MDKKEALPRASRPVQGVRHVADILRHVSKAARPVRINELARQVGLDKSSISRIVATLEQEKLIQRTSEGGLCLGLGLLVITAPLIRDLDPSTSIKPSLAKLAQTTGETVNLSIWNGREAVSLVQELGSSAITHYAAPGHTSPAHCSASGKVLLAFEPDEAIAEVLSAPLQSYTARTVTDPAALRAELEEVKVRGYAINLGEYDAEVCAVAAAVFDHDGRLFGALTVTAPAYRFGPARRERIRLAAITAARELSDQFGYRG